MESLYTCLISNGPHHTSVIDLMILVRRRKSLHFRVTKSPQHFLLGIWSWCSLHSCLSLHIFACKLTFFQISFLYSLLIYFFFFFCNYRILAFFFSSVLRFQYLVHSVKAVMKICSYTYSEISESRVELSQLPTQCAIRSQSLFLFSIPNATPKVKALWLTPCSLTQKTLCPSPCAWLIFYSLKALHFSVLYPCQNSSSQRPEYMCSDMKSEWWWQWSCQSQQQQPMLP